ncbi:hypothetical protein TD95_004667 [Thielaviopsis punctulata]|uniref:Roadblock/LAMTOR2 domain-containing protein n=1 Tax=Thielaviopsis punctulata TaxID=72032 RepID=A0A0F4ZFE1_9PEZI|nr:hypothetical protein TD95_004667 [Thielaviopsis punctulata]
MSEPAPQQTTNNHDALEEALARLSKKPGVKATIVLDRTNGAVMKTSGNISSLRPVKVRSEPRPASPTTPTPVSGTFSIPTAHEIEMKGAEDYAALVWAFVKTAGALVDDLEADDEMRLLRLRTKRQELVIVPDTKYLLILIHDTP